VELLPLTAEIAVRATTLSDEIRDPADRLVAATALELALPLVSRDEGMVPIPGLCVVW
jgi:PIN domain nuclease of toxin-antitoxin system